MEMGGSWSGTPKAKNRSFCTKRKAESQVKTPYHPSPITYHPVRDGHRLDLAMRCEAEDLPVEIELTFECATDILRTAEPMPLAGEDQQRHRQPARRHCLVHRLRLIGRHHRVFATLEEDQWLGEALQVVNRRALHVDVLTIRIWPDETVEVARLELVGVGRHRL